MPEASTLMSTLSSGWPARADSVRFSMNLVRTRPNLTIICFPELQLTAHALAFSLTIRHVPVDDMCQSCEDLTCSLSRSCSFYNFFILYNST